jgi:hypothetical protein
MPMVRDARVTGPISRAVCHHEPVRAVDSISLPAFIELLKNHPLVREKKGSLFRTGTSAKGLTLPGVGV